TGGTQVGAVSYTSGGDELWYTGGPQDTNSGSVVVGQPPTPGAQLLLSQIRTYYFSISLKLGGEFRSIGQTPAPTTPTKVDSWHANMVINESKTFTNTTGSSLVLTMDKFQFNAKAVTDPITPFVVRVNSNNNFTVLAIGTPRSSYVVGSNGFAFSDTTTTLTLSPGEVIAPCFLDALPDGTGGTG